MPPKPEASLVVREHKGRPFFEAKFRYEGRQVKRRIGPAWVERAADGSWKRQHGRVPDGSFDERRAHAAAAAIVADYVGEAQADARRTQERIAGGVTFRELSGAYLDWLGRVKDAKPATLRNHGYVLAEPGIPYRRGKGQLLGHVMKALGDKPAAGITARDVEALLRRMAASGASVHTVNKARNVIVAAFNYGMRESAFGLPSNPALGSDHRREPHPGALLFYSPSEVESIADGLAEGVRRRKPEQRGADDIALDRQDAELIRVAGFTGLRLGELLALRWKDVDLEGRVLTVARALSAGIETTTKSGQVRHVPIPDQAAAALTRLSARPDFREQSELVFANPITGRHLHPVTVRKRYKQARDAVGVRPLRFHDLRHTYGSLLARSGVDLVTIKEAMGHSALTTTSRYLHARPATEQAASFTKAFAGGAT